MTDGVLKHCWQTPIGFVEVTIKDDALCSIQLLNKSSDHDDNHPLFAVIKKQLDEYIKGKRQSFDVPLKPEGTVFQKAVWKATQKIPYGKTKTYGEIAKSIGKPLAARAVGGALNKNPLLLVVPCHRIVGSDGSMTGFACGVNVKESLLTMEKRFQ